MSAVMNLASCVDMTLLSKHLVVVELAVSVENMSEHSSRVPPIVTCTRCVSALLGWSEATSLQYEMFWSDGTADCLTKNIVFVPLFMRVPTPCACQPRPLAKNIVHNVLAGPRIRCM